VDSELLYALSQSNQGTNATWAASTSPPTPTAPGQLWYQTDTNVLVVWNGTAWTSVYYQNSTFKAYATTGQSFPAGTTKVSFPSLAFNYGTGTFDTVNYRYTPGTSGYYLITSTVRFLYENASAEQILLIYKNGAQFGYGGASMFYNLSAGDNLGMSVTDIVYLNGVTDYVEIWFTNAGATTSAAAAGYQIFMSGSLVGH